MPIDSKECFAALTEDGQLWEIYQAAQSGGGGITSINGDTTAAQLISGTAPITASTAAGTTTISTSMNTARLLGRTTAGVGVAEEITVGTGLSLTGGTLSSTATGTVTNVTATAPLTSSGGATPDISTSIATNRIVGRSTAGTGVMEQLTPVGITVSGGNITGIGGTTGTTDNVIARADGTGGYTVQPSGLIIDDAIVSFTGITGTAGAPTPDVITATGSAFVSGQPVRFTALTGGSGLNTTTNYFVVNPSGATFQVETSIGGGAVNFTTDITAGTLLTGHSVSTNVTLSENTTATNSDLVLTPKGTGALIAGPKPNGAATGGNARGANAVDLQTSRAAATQVASGSNSVIGGGINNIASGAETVVCGGNGNQATSSNAPNGAAAICGGAFNVASGTYGSFIGGGVSNTASGRTSVVAGGQQNSASTSNYPAVVCGYQNSASGETAFIGGGRENAASGNYTAIVGGYQANATRFGQQSHGAGQFSVNGDAQRARFVLRCKTTTNAAVEMALDGGTTYLTIPNGKVIFMNIKVVGTKSDGSAVATYERQYAVKNVSLTSSQVYAPITIGTDNAAGTTLEVATVDAGDYVRIRPTGIASETWRWVASVDAVEVAYGT